MLTGAPLSLSSPVFSSFLVTFCGCLSDTEGLAAHGAVLKPPLGAFLYCLHGLVAVASLTILWAAMSSAEAFPEGRDPFSYGELARHSPLGHELSEGPNA